MSPSSALQSAALGAKTFTQIHVKTLCALAIRLGKTGVDIPVTTSQRTPKSFRRYEHPTSTSRSEGVGVMTGWGGSRFLVRAGGLVLSLFLVVPAGVVPTIPFNTTAQ